MNDATTEVSIEEFVRSVYDPGVQTPAVLDLWRDALRNGDGLYAVCLGSSKTSDIDGISAAGADGEQRRLTPAIDAEALVTGRALSAPTIPASPAGIVSPVVISRAMLDLVHCRIKVFDCGAFVPPKVPVVNVGGCPAERLDSGKALDRDIVQVLYDAGCKAGAAIAQQFQFLVVGECMPAGTTTALAVLTGLGYPAAELVSSSMPRADRDLRNKLVADGLSRSGLDLTSAQKMPLHLVAAVGDPMQAFTAGLAGAASGKIPVILGGGTQMLAVYAILQAIFQRSLADAHKLAVVTTKWVAYDPHAGAGRLAQLIGAPFAASCPDFELSRHAGLRAYEQGHVKEGIGAGAMMAAASLTGNSEMRILNTIDDWYDRMVPQIQP